MRQIGPHRVTNVSVDSPEIEKLFSDGRQADILYSDPPWGDGNVGMWHTVAERDNPGLKVPRLSHDSLMNRIMDLIDRFVSGHVFIEMGNRWADDLLDRMRRIGLDGLQVIDLVYNGGAKNLPNKLLYGSKVRPVQIDILTGLIGGKCSRQAVALTATRGGIVFDPCCGKGYSAAAALAAGMEFRGNEFNPLRLERTIARLG